MGLFSKKKKEFMEMPPPPPQEAASLDEELKFPELPPLPEESTDKVFEELPPLPEEVPPPFFEQPPKPQIEKKIEAPTERQILPKKKALQPLFISVDDYQFILDGIASIKKKITESNQGIEELEKIKTAEENLLNEWKLKISDIEKKLSYVDKAVLKSKD